MILPALTHVYFVHKEHIVSIICIYNNLWRMVNGNLDPKILLS